MEQIIGNKTLNMGSHPRYGQMADNDPPSSISCQFKQESIKTRPEGCLIYASGKLSHERSLI